ncbi:MAG: LamG domain-containing protein, partial [Solirubrobacteraceae bacterium]
MSRPRMKRRSAAAATMLALALGALAGGAFVGVSVTAAAVTLPALAGHWPMIEAGGGTTADTSGNANTAYLGSGASWTTGPAGAPAIALNGTSAGIVPVFKSVINTSQSFTVSAWVKFNNTNGNQTFVSMDGTHVSGFFLQINGTPGKFAFIRYDSDSTSSPASQALSSVTPTAGTWYHVVAEDNTSTGQLQLYVNGSEDATAAYTANWQDSGVTLIGRGFWNGAPSDFVNGAVSDVQMYQAALSSAQVAALSAIPVLTATTTAGAGSGTATVTDANPLAACGNAAKCLTYAADPLTITAAAGSGARFTGWSGGTCAGVLNPCSFASAKSETDKASFAKTVTVTVATGGGGAAAITDSDPLANCTKVTTCVADVGDSLTLTATAAPGWSLTGWSGGSCSGTAATCVIGSVSANTTVSVAFSLPLAGTAAQAIFVSPAGSDANPGTQSAPVLTPAHALALVEASKGSKDQLRLAQGSYSGGLSLTSADDGVAIYGGFVASSWAPSGAPATATTISGAPAALVADHATGVLLQQLELTGQAASGASASVYGVRAIDASKLTLSDVGVVAAGAAPG